MPTSTRVLQVLELFKRAPIELAIVIDEHGGFEGVLTRTDLLEVIAGDLPEQAGEEPGVKALPDGALSIGRRPLVAGPAGGGWKLEVAAMDGLSVRRLVARRAKLFDPHLEPDRLEAHQYFGDFVLNGDAVAGELAAVYGFAVPDGVAAGASRQRPLLS